MKNLLLFFGVMAFLASCNSSGELGGGKAYPIETKQDSMSYSLGQSLGTYIKNSKEAMGDSDELNFDLNLIVNGIVEAQNGEPRLTEAEFNKYFREISTIVRAAKKSQISGEPNENLKKSMAFLAKNKEKEGVITTPSGLQYEVLKEGDGPNPTQVDKAKVHYHGKLINGTVFDSSVQKNSPYTFSLSGGVIKGWLEGVPLMKLGGKTRFFVPPNLGYGARANNKIPGNSVLIFDIELLEIFPPAIDIAPIKE